MVNGTTAWMRTGADTHRVSQQGVSHLVSQDDGELVNIRHALQHSREDEDLSVLHR